MSRKITVPKYYETAIPGTMTKKSKTLSVDSVFAVKDFYNSLTTPEGIKVNFSRVLPSDVNIFSELPVDVYQDEVIKKFLACLRKSLLKLRTENVTLSKLCISERSDTGIVFDWIFNYFRAYFSFDKKDGNYYGILKSNPVNKSFTNDFKEMKEEEFEDVADFVVSYIITMLTA